MKAILIFGLLIICFEVDCRLEFDLYKKSPPKIRQNPIRTKRHLQDNPWHNDSVVLFKYMDTEYYGLVGIGSPSKTFKMQFDTTWSDIFLPSSHCSYAEIACRNHQLYDSSKSSSYHKDGRPVNLTSPSISIAGFLSIDTFHLAHVKVVDQTFIEATHISQIPYNTTEADGVIGLGFSQASEAKITPFFYNLIDQRVIEKNIFTFYMNRDETTEKAGRLILGATDRAHVRGDLSVLDVISDDSGLWKVAIDRIVAIKNKTETYFCKEGCRGYFDTSSNAIVGPPKEIDQINWMLDAIYEPMINKYTVSCRTYAKLPEVGFQFKNQTFLMASKYYVQKMIIDHTMACFSPFVPGDNDNVEWQIGGAFLMEFYTEYDLDNKVINIGETLF